MVALAGRGPEQIELSRRLLADLVSFPTLPESDNLDLIDWVASYLSGFSIESHRVLHPDGNRGGLVATIGAQDEGGLALSAHTDVVDVRGQRWSHEPFTLTEDNGRLFGRGTVDMKGFIACALAMVPTWVGRPAIPPVHLVLSYDEEIGCRGTSAMVDGIRELGLSIRGIVVGEPTGMAPIIGHKGKVSIEVRFHGRAGHSSMPASGTNAIHAAAEFVQEIRAAQLAIEADFPVDREHRVPFSTLHVGKISGGTALNIIPDFASVSVEARTVGTQSVSKVRDLIDRAARASAERTDTSVTFAELGAYPGLSTPSDDPFVQLVKAASSSSQASKVDYGTEAGMLAKELGVPAVVCGPGDIERAHKADEYILDDELEQCIAFLDRLVTLATRSGQPHVVGAKRATRA